MNQNLSHLFVAVLGEFGKKYPAFVLQTKTEYMDYIWKIEKPLSTTVRIYAFYLAEYFSKLQNFL